MQLLTGLCMVVVGLGYIKATADFDCRRTYQSCVNGECDDTAGGCICPADAAGTATHSNKDCGLETALVRDPTACDPPCQNGGACFEPVTGTFMCMCSEEFYGGQCENKRKQVECAGDMMTINYMPIPTFEGVVFILDNRDTAECVFTKDDVTGMFSARFTYLQCGVLATPDTPAPGDTSYTVAAAVRFNANIERGTDMKLTAECSIDGSGQSPLSTKIGLVSVDQRANLTEETALTLYQPVSLSLEDKNGGPLPAPVYLGDELRMYIPLSDTGKYTKLKITDLLTSNGMTGTDLVEEILVADGCLTDIGEALITGDISSDPATPAIIINFMAYRLRGAAQVKFDAIVKVCESADLTCDPVTCVPSIPTVRKRRAAPDNEVILHETLTVLDPRSNDKLRLSHDKSGKKNQQNADPQQCLQSTEIMVMVIVLIVAVVLLLVITTCLAVKFMKQRATQNKIYNSDMPTGDNTVRIPRAAF